MIRNPNDIQDGAKKIRMLIAGYPGIGKSTLALSSPRPLHIDCDFGIDRIEPRYRMPYIQPRSYDEILNDLKPENLKDFETLVFDTAGKLITLMGLWAIKQNPKYGQRDGSLSLKGYGFVGREFVRLMDYCFYELKKNIVVVFHATEERTAITPVSASRLRARPRTMCGSLWIWAASWKCTATTAPLVSPTVRSILPRAPAASTVSIRFPPSAPAARTTS